MSNVEKVYHITKNMVTLLQQSDEANREELMQQMEKLISKRALLLRDLKEPATDEEHRIGEKIIQLNKYIEKEMKQIFTNIKVDMKQVQQHKESNVSYIDPYRNVQTTGGMYLDSKQ